MSRIAIRYGRLEAELVNAAGMTKRQEEVARLFIQDKTKFEIAKELGISPATAEDHLNRLKDRFEATTRLDLLCQMWMHGILQAKNGVRALVILLALFAAFPMARNVRPSPQNRVVARLVRVGRQEIPGVFGGAV